MVQPVLTKPLLSQASPCAQHHCANVHGVLVYFCQKRGGTLVLTGNIHVSWVNFLVVCIIGTKVLKISVPIHEYHLELNPRDMTIPSVYPIVHKYSQSSTPFLAITYKYTTYLTHVVVSVHGKRIA